MKRIYVVEIHDKDGWKFFGVHPSRKAAQGIVRWLEGYLKGYTDTDQREMRIRTGVLDTPGEEGELYKKMNTSTPVQWG